MSADSIPKRCDECGRQMAKAHRVHKGHRYCSTCYSRVFKIQICPKCSSLARLPKSDPAALCRKCENDKPCIRCRRVGYSIGKVTAYGPVCNACAPYFRTPEPCEACGELSPKLTRVSRLGHNRRVCPKCARTDFGTCMACARHRLLREAPDGRMLCRVCLEKGEVPCSKCRKPMPAGHGNHCQRCYWRGLLEKRILIDCVAFSSSAMAAHFEAFGKWLDERVGGHKAALLVHRYLPFFMEIENQWNGIPGYAVLLAHFGAANLRRVLLPIRWMEVTNLVVPDGAAKADDSERRRIAVTLGRFTRGSKEKILLEGYHKVLLERLKSCKTTLRSIRLALSPAAALLGRATVMTRMPPDQGVLDAYLAKTQGQRAAVSGFVRYLRQAHEVEIALPKADSSKAQRQRRKKLEAEMLSLIRATGDSEKLTRRWLSAALAYFHGLPKRAVGTNWKNLLHYPEVRDGLIFRWDGLEYWIPIRPEGTRSGQVNLDGVRLPT